VVAPVLGVLGVLGTPVPQWQTQLRHSPPPLAPARHGRAIYPVRTPPPDARHNAHSLLTPLRHDQTQRGHRARSHPHPRGQRCVPPLAPDALTLLRPATLRTGHSAARPRICADRIGSSDASAEGRGPHRRGHLHVRRNPRLPLPRHRAVRQPAGAEPAGARGRLLPRLLPLPARGEL
jgi:hypothetical protein